MHLLSAEEMYQLIGSPGTRCIRRREVENAQLLILNGRLSCLLEPSPPFGPKPLAFSSAGIVFKISLQEFFFPGGKLPRHWTRGLKMLRATLRVLSPPTNHINMLLLHICLYRRGILVWRILTNVTGKTPFWLLTKRTLIDDRVRRGSDVGKTGSESAFVAGVGEGLYETCSPVYECVISCITLRAGATE